MISQNEIEDLITDYLSNGSQLESIEEKREKVPRVKKGISKKESIKVRKAETAKEKVSKNKDCKVKIPMSDRYVEGQIRIFIKEWEKQL